MNHYMQLPLGIIRTVLVVKAISSYQNSIPLGKNMMIVLAVLNQVRKLILINLLVQYLNPKNT